MTTYPAEDRAYLSPRPRQPNPWLIRLPMLFIVGVILLLLALVLLAGVFHSTYEGKITPGVNIYGADVSGMSYEEAVNTVVHRFTFDDEAVFTFAYPPSPELDALFAQDSAALQRTAGELGISFDVEATVGQAFALTDDAGTPQGLLDQALIWFNGETIAPIVRYEQNTARAYLTELAQRIDQQPTAYNAQVDADGEVIMGAAGRRLDVEATLTELNRAILELDGGATIPLVIETLAPPTTVTNAEEVAVLRNAALSGSLQLVADDPLTGAQFGPWEIGVEQIDALLTVDLTENADGTTSYDIGVDFTPFRASLEALAPGLVTYPSDGRFHFDEFNGELQVVQPSLDGRRMNVDATLQRLEQAVFRTGDRTVPIAFDYTQPRYHSGVTAAELGITQLVTEATTYYTGSEDNRRHNIAQGASRFDGIIIGPGEEFSFNYHLGELSAETGFVEGKVIVGGRTVGGIGGGICQVSTTVFRAAFQGGFTIIERNSHAYRVGYYELNGAPPGLDAAIWTPERDFRFQNDTPYHLLIETAIYPAESVLQFRFYSTNPGRVVEIEAPTVRNVEPAPPLKYEPNGDLQPGEVIQVDYAADGADVNVRRVIYDMQGNQISEDNIFTHYLPWQAVFQVNPNDSRLASGG